MLPTRGYAAMAACAPLQPFLLERRDVGAHDILLTISHCGICHPDIHMTRNEWASRFSPWCPAMKSSAPLVKSDLR